jgi:hypothetical protein
MCNFVKCRRGEPNSRQSRLRSKRRPVDLVCYSRDSRCYDPNSMSIFCACYLDTVVQGAVATWSTIGLQAHRTTCDVKPRRDNLTRQILPRRRRIRTIKRIVPIPPDGQYPQFRLYGHVGTAPISKRIRITTRMVPILHLLIP